MRTTKTPTPGKPHLSTSHWIPGWWCCKVEVNHQIVAHGAGATVRGAYAHCANDLRKAQGA